MNLQAAEMRGGRRRVEEPVLKRRLKESRWCCHNDIAGELFHEHGSVSFLRSYEKVFLLRADCVFLAGFPGMTVKFDTSR
jgi:hypothetical protein